MSNTDPTNNTTQKTKKMSNTDPTNNTTQKTKKMANTDPTNNTTQHRKLKRWPTQTHQQHNTEN